MKEKYEKIMEKKISSSIETLCKGFPDEIPAFIHYTRDLKFDDRPDYGFLRRLFKTIFEKEKLEFDNDFDWFKNPSIGQKFEEKLGEVEVKKDAEAKLSNPTKNVSSQKINSFNKGSIFIKPCR